MENAYRYKDCKNGKKETESFESQYGKKAAGKSSVRERKRTNDKEFGEKYLEGTHKPSTHTRLHNMVVYCGHVHRIH